MKTAVFSGRFDPPHIGHVLTIIRLLKRYDRVVVVVLDYPERESCPAAKAKEIFIEVLSSIRGNGIITVMVNNTHFGKITRSKYILLIDECCADAASTVYVSGNQQVIDHFKKEMKGLMFEFIDRSENYSGTDIREMQKEGLDGPIQD
jgi:nicotinamide mononucleotide adenylyltransferase